MRTTFRTIRLQDHINRLPIGASASIGDWFEIDEVSIRLVNAGTLHAHGKGIFDGNVGIGTANPASKLSVVGDIHSGKCMGFRILGREFGQRLS